MPPTTPKVDRDRKIHTIADALLDASTTKLINRQSPEPNRSTEENGVGDRNQSGLAETDGLNQRDNLSLRLRTAPRQARSPSLTVSSEIATSAGAGGPASQLSLSTPGNRDASSETRVSSDGTYGVGSENATPRSYSALGLLKSADKRAKTSAEISTTSTTVAGKLNSQSTRRTSPYAQSQLQTQYQRAHTMPEVDASPASRRLLISHSYNGKDPIISNFLDTVFIDRYPTDLIDFGPLVQPINTNSPIKKATAVPAQPDEDEPWRPQGVLVALYNEHIGPVNRVVVSPDHVFFATASDDGTVKLWDTGRLEKNLTTKSRNTHRHAPGAKVKCLTFIEGTHIFVSAATDGSIHAVRADCRKTSDGSTFRYGKLRLIKDFNIYEDLEITENVNARRFPGEYATWMEHVRTTTDSLLLVATNRSRIIALNLKTMRPSYILDNPVRHGNITTFCLDKKKNWLVLGTTHGVMDLWDLRFQLRLKSWGLPGKGSPIHRIVLHPLKGRGRWVCVAGGGIRDSEVMVWDIEKAQCVEVYQGEPTPAYTDDTDVGMSDIKPTFPSTNVQDYEAWKIDEDPNIASDVFERMATTPLHHVDTHNDDGARSSQIAISPPAATSNLHRFPSSVRALVPCIDVQSEDKKSAFLISGGFDRKIRLWDVGFPEASRVISGVSLTPSPDSASGAQSQPLESRFQIVQSTPGFVMVAEDFVYKSPPRHDKAGEGDGHRSMEGGSKRKTLVSLQQQDLLRSHLDAILDIALLRSPYGMTISVDRGGMIYVFR